MPVEVTPAMRTLRATGEACFALTVLALINLGWAPEDPGLLGWSPHPSLYIATFLVSRHGLAGAWVATLLFGIEHIGLLLTNCEFPTPLDVLAPAWTKPLLVVAPVALILGVGVDRALRRAWTAQKTLERSQHSQDKLQKHVNLLRAENVKLGIRVIAGQGSLATLHRLMRGLNSSDLQSTLSSTCRLAAEVLSEASISLWQVGPLGAPVKVAAAGPFLPRPILHVGTDLTAYFDAQGVLDASLLPEQLLKPELPLLVGRLRAGDGGPLVGYLCVDAVGFANSDRELRRNLAIVVACANQAIGTQRSG